MKVLKFGGTSVGTPESLQYVQAIVNSQTEPCIVVVSALGGLTDKLIATAEAAAAGDASYEERHQEIYDRHKKVCSSVTPKSRLSSVWNKVSFLLDELSAVFKAIYLLRELTEHSKDLVVSYGERMSSIIVTSMFDNASLANSLEFIRTHKHFGKNVLDQDASTKLIKETFNKLRNTRITTVPGFISRDQSERITNLGRGGSDYTAAILAAELNADVLEIWTDVDGFMSADPRIVENARIIDRLSFVEAMELCNFGAKVVYPPTIYPVFHKNIPIIIKNTFNPKAEGTRICDGEILATDILGVSAISDTHLITLKNAKNGLYERMINRLAGQGIETLMPDGRKCCGVRGSDVKRAEELLRDEFAQELIHNTIEHIAISEKLSTVALVCRGNQLGVDTTSELLSALNSHGIPVVHAPQQASPCTVACMVNANNLSEAIQVIHSTFIHN